jgi:signal transduction histidine kinase
VEARSIVRLISGFASFPRVAGVAGVREWSRAHPLIVDALLAALLFVGAVASDDLSRQVNGIDRGYHLDAIASMALITVPLAWRRRFPLVACATSVAGTAAGSATGVLDGTFVIAALFLALVSAGAYGGSRRTVVRSLAVAVILATVVWAVIDAPSSASLAVYVVAVVIVFNVVFCAAAWIVGDVVLRSTQRRAELEERTRELESERELRARRAVIDERLRIARELHDVVAHHVSVMGVQAAAARRVLARRPQDADRALGTIEASSRSAVSELHQLLGFLRNSDTDDRADVVAPPQPTLADLEELVISPATLHVVGEPTSLSAGVELSIYRIVQEALTNARKHARAERVDVVLAYEPRRVVIEILDDGRGASVVPSGGGQGTRGMRERASLHGGTIDIGPRLGGGFRVRAVFPIGRHTIVGPAA